MLSIAHANTIEFSVSPCFKNFKKSNTQRAAAALHQAKWSSGSCIIAAVGDSTFAGYGAGVGKTGYNDARRFSATRHLEWLLVSDGYYAQEVGIFGSAGAGAEYSNYDPRVSLSDDWRTESCGPGGGFYKSSTGQGAFTFKPGDGFRRATVWYACDPEGAHLVVKCDGKRVAVVDTRGRMAVDAIEITTEDAHELSFSRFGDGSVTVLGCTVSSQTSCVDIWNLGICGAKIETLNRAHRPWSPRPIIEHLAPHLIFLNVGINDWVHGTPLLKFQKDYEEVVDAWTQQSDVIVVNPVPRGTASTPLEQQLAYADVIRRVAAESDLPLLDLRTVFHSQERARQHGLYHDVTHPSARGYALVGRHLSKAVALIGSEEARERYPSESHG